jgi:phosphoenolpyruvate carboxykinase (ATP)
MQEHGTGAEQLVHLGLKNLGNVYWNLSTPTLYEEVVRRREGWISHLGPLVVHTGHHIGRSPNDKFIVREPTSEAKIAWGKVNRPMEAAKFDALHAKLCAFFQGRDVFIQNLYGGADPRYRIPVRVVTDYAWHNLFARNLLLQPEEPVIHTSPETFTIMDSPRFHASPEADGTNSEVFVVINFAKRLAIIGGTTYAGEIKKSVFTILNYLLPAQGVFPMHCSANVGKRGDTALFFGLSGTGKTTLSADPDRSLIGDDEHGWSDDGVFNFEGGCYAKVIRLNAAHEPEIFRTTRTFGTVLENVSIDAAGNLDLDSDAKTENTRAAYPIHQLDNIVPEGRAGHPRNVVFLTADAFGVLPPISKLTAEQAMYFFLSGYTAKVAGTERGVKEPQATFSACFGEPFLPLPPSEYAKMLGEKIKSRQPNVWLINTGWTAGPYGVGHRIAIPHTRAMIRAALAGTIAESTMAPDPIFGLRVPSAVPGVPGDVLNPRGTWGDAKAYDAQATKLAEMFRENFKRYGDQVAGEIKSAGPRG